MAIHTIYQSTSSAAAFELLIWETTESLDFFVQELQLSTAQYLELQQQYSHPNALSQWLSSRYALQRLFKLPYWHFKKNSLGKLELKNSPFQLSISHSNQYTAVVKSTKAIGLDVQVPNKKLGRIASKYIDSSTLNHLKKSPFYQDYLHLYWAIKEALFKAYGLGQLNYIQHLRIEPFEIQEKGIGFAQIIKENLQLNYQVHYQKLEDYYLCIAIEN